jgi:acyl-coenzyme A thioesterase PaaI-like protein
VSDEPVDPKWKRFSHWDASRAEEISGVWGERRRLARAMRGVIEHLVRSDAPEAELKRAADRLEEYAAHLDSHPRNPRYEGFAEAAPAGDVGAFLDQSPVIGQANPLAPPLELRAAEDGMRVLGRVRFGSAYEGAPGCVHGGYVAAIFDEALGFAQSLSAHPGMTGTLTVRYRSPTPLHTELRMECWVDRTEGRKVFARGTLHASDVLAAESEGIFISIDPSRFQALLRERAAREA